VQVHRIGATTYNLHIRVYDDDGVLVLSDSDFVNAAGSGTADLSETPTFTFRDVNTLANFQCGTNGAFQGTVEGDHPVTFCHQGGFAVSAADWCGPYVSGEAPV
jgi:hypothetical protein